jgi:hypothetical protein
MGRLWEQLFQNLFYGLMGQFEPSTPHLPGNPGAIDLTPCHGSGAFDLEIVTILYLLEILDLVNFAF